MTEAYLSPFSTRYGSERMREIWSRENERRSWRKAWVVLLIAQGKQGLWKESVPVDFLMAMSEKVDLATSDKNEEVTRHDLVAELQTFADQLGHPWGDRLHVGVTSSDIQDLALPERVGMSIDWLKPKMQELIWLLAKAIRIGAEQPCVGRTHLLPAEITTVGHRLAVPAVSVVRSMGHLLYSLQEWEAKRISGPVGTAAVLGYMTNYLEFLGDVSSLMGNQPEEMASSQTASRFQDVIFMQKLANIGTALAKLAFDLRVMSGFGEISISKSAGQLGSSAMPFKSNPIMLERVCSLARHINALSQVATENYSSQLLERTLDDSANRHAQLPEAFLAVEQMVEDTRYSLEHMLFHVDVLSKTVEAHHNKQILAMAVQLAPLYGASRIDSLRKLSSMVIDSESPPDVLISELTMEIFGEFKDEFVGRLEAISDTYPRSVLGEAPRQARNIAGLLEEWIEMDG